jgi:hypothetical protein
MCEILSTSSLYCNILCVFVQGIRYPLVKSTFCGRGLPLDYYSETNNVLVTFQSNSAVGGKGFKLRYAVQGAFVQSVISVYYFCKRNNLLHLFCKFSAIIQVLN